MDAAEKQRLIDDHVMRARVGYADLWRAMVDNWRADGGDALWLTYAANYLLRTGGVRWAIDPYCLAYRLEGIPHLPVGTDLAACQVVVLTHTHRDHFDQPTLQVIKDIPAIWVVPEFMLERVQASLNLPAGRVVVPQPGISLRFDGLTLTPFDGLHLTPGHGVPAMGYLAEFSGKRWLFPGDTRIYDPQQLPSFGRLDGGLAHLWLGRGAALQASPPLLQAFCEFWTALAPGRLVLTHLHELERKPSDYWDESHADLVIQQLSLIQPEMNVEVSKMGDQVNL